MVTGVVPHVVESRVRDTWNTDILDMRGVHGSGRDVSGLLARAHRLHRRADRVWSAEK